MPTQKLYWVFQIVGWLTMLLYELVNYIGLGVFSFASFGWLSIAVAVALFFTHIYHLIIRSINYFSLPLYQQLLYFFIALIILSVSLMGVSTLEEFLLYGKLSAGFFTVQSLMVAVNWSRYIVVWLLFYHIVKYFQLKNRAEVAVLKTTLELQDTRLNVLRLQLNPHFLFNALNSIRSLITYDTQQAREATTRLSQLLRHTLNYEQQDFIPVKQEMDIVVDYLMLEKIRFDERLDYNINVDEAAANTQVPASLILTLVENAIKHGIGNSIKGGNINISVLLQPGRLFIQVVNPGQVIATKTPYAGIGLQNIKKRLELYYANNAAFILENINSQSVSATVHIPANI